ncbi:hypothetical protein E4U43_001101 [Claviceps pusilla]|uniref:Uncharacterized protein n=1 Tax=Claviceps pusilla TaxID=123648 RepID=A0A9P7N8W6_9HYPO|nr:hypothetical protein E4U43_001101 [Claviceps pusilla]
MASQAQQHHQHQQYQRHQQHQQPSLQYSQPTAEQQYGGQAKPRTYSIHSQRTYRSSGSKHDFHETHEEKEAKRLHSKADPTLAMNEAEPSMVAAMKPDSTKASIRSMQHRDPWGNPIADPDKSNPTRNRWERPLDTIRSFEAAIDGGYQRKSLYRADTDSAATWNRRNSYNPLAQPRLPQDSYHGSRPVSYRAESQSAVPTPAVARASYYDMQNAGASNYDRAIGNRRMSRDRGPKSMSDSHYQVYGREPGVYPMPHKDRSYETVTSAAPSGHSDPAGYQTDPTSSENSSIDRISPAKRNEPINDYGIGFSQSQGYEVPGFTVSNPNRNHPLPPPPPPHDNTQATARPTAFRKGSLLRRQPTQESSNVTNMNNNSDKRKSWFGRRFSKGG